MTKMKTVAPVAQQIADIAGQYNVFGSDQIDKHKADFVNTLNLWANRGEGYVEYTLPPSATRFIICFNTRDAEEPFIAEIIAFPLREFDATVDYDSLNMELRAAL